MQSLLQLLQKIGPCGVERLAQTKAERVQMHIPHQHVQWLRQWLRVDEQGVLAPFGFGVGNHLADVCLAGFVWGFVFGIQHSQGTAVAIIKRQINLEAQLVLGANGGAFLRLDLVRRGQVGLQPVGHAPLVQQRHVEQEGDHLMLAVGQKWGGLLQKGWRNPG